VHVGLLVGALGSIALYARRSKEANTDQSRLKNQNMTEKVDAVARRPPRLPQVGPKGRKSSEEVDDVAMRPPRLQQVRPKGRNSSEEVDDVATRPPRLQQACPNNQNTSEKVDAVAMRSPWLQQVRPNNQNTTEKVDAVATRPVSLPSHPNDLQTTKIPRQPLDALQRTDHHTLRLKTSRYESSGRTALPSG